MTAAAAIIAGPAFHAGFLAQHVALLELTAQIIINNAGVHRADLIGFFAYKLMAGLQIALWADGQIVVSSAAAR